MATTPEQPAHAEAIAADAAVQADPAALAEKIASDVATLDAELKEIDLLILQARAEGERHEAKRATAADKVGGTQQTDDANPTELAELNAQLVNLTRRAVVMESQVDVLNGKQKALHRYRDGLAEVGHQLAAMAGHQPPDWTVGPDARRSDRPEAPGVGAARDLAATAPVPLSPAVSRMVMTAQEDLRRDIARAMHDGPAQSLTNIVLQAQIVDRLLASDVSSARAEVRHLIAMVQATLEATKTFIFDVRPMVLDDLGLMPTLRRAARDRGRRAQIPVDFDSLGPDRRLPIDLESAIFRMLDQVLAAFLAVAPDRIALRLDWADQQLDAVVRSLRDLPDAVAEQPTGVAEHVERPSRGTSRGKEKVTAVEAELPPALAAMMEARDGERAAAQAASDAPVAIPAAAWRDLEARAATLSARATLSADRSELRLVVDLPPAA